MSSLLPGLYVAACFLALSALLRRIGEPLPWRVALALVALVLAVFAPVLLGGQVLLPLDNLRAHPPFANLPAPAVHGNYLQADLVTLVAPALARQRAAFEAGQWGLWNPLVGTGVPLLADPQAQALQPLQLLALPFPLATAAGVVAALRVLVAMLFTFLFLRRQRLDEGASLAGALAWGLGGFLLLWLGWPLANVGALLPAVLWSIALALDRGERRDLAAVLLATSALALAGHPEGELYAGFLAGAFALARGRALARVDDGARRRLLRMAAATALGVLVALPMALPAARAAAQSERAAGLLARRTALPGTVRVAAPEWERDPGTFARGRLLPIAVPNVFGNDRYGSYWGPENVNEDSSGFVGTATLLLALLGALAGAGGGRVAPPAAQERLLQVTVALSLLLVVLPPALRPWADRLPLALQSTTYYHRLLLLAGFGLACLAAFELDRVVRGTGASWPWVVAAAAVLATVVVWATSSHPSPERADALDVLRYGWLRWHLRFLGVAAIVLLAGRRRWWAGPTVAALIAAELLLAHAPANPAMPPALAFPRSPVLELAGERLQGQRLVGLEGTLPPNLAALYGLADIRAYDPMGPAACAQVQAFARSLTLDDVAPGSPHRERLAALGVRFLLAPPRVAVPAGYEEAYADDTATLLTAAAAPLRRLEPPAGDRRALLTTVCQDGGWRLLGDGRPVPGAIGSRPFLTADLPSGTRRVESVYRPAGFLAGCLLAAFGAAAALPLTLRPPARRATDRWGSIRTGSPAPADEQGFASPSP